MSDEFYDNLIKIGHWRILFRPIGEINTLKITDIQNIVINNQVSLRGWSFPFVTRNPAENRGIDILDNAVRGWIDADHEKEFWTMYQSSQFIAIKALNEDLYSKDDLVRYFGNEAKHDEGILNFVGGLIFHLTEVYEFLSRLVANGLYPNGVEVSISLRNTKGRILVGSGRHLSSKKITSAKIINFNIKYSADELTSNIRNLSIEAMIHFFERFGWSDVDIENVLKKDQMSLYNRDFT